MDRTLKCNHLLERCGLFFNLVCNFGKYIKFGLGMSGMKGLIIKLNDKCSFISAIPFLLIKCWSGENLH